MSDKKFNVGDKVRYIGKDHIDYPEYYPTIGTIGKITGVPNDDPDCYIQWPKNSTSGNDEHWCSTDDIELVENVDMTNEEIWEMLKPKMEKNALTTQNIHTGSFWPIYTYNANDVHNAIAIAYRSGYERAIKGRPFKFGEKKKERGHWEPVDSNNLPKEGTRVRYARECKSYSRGGYGEYMITLGDEGKFEYRETIGLPGIHFDDGRFWNWVCFSNSPECLDMWVEDDE